ncbi:hypothetical protein J6590_012830 [Homalodisca vitripennis]|nr:hypothetical protein J6590_012830 [Homalodisca vitripennis]
MLNERALIVLWAVISVPTHSDVVIRKRLIQLTSERPDLDVGLSVFDRVYTDSFQHRFSSYTDERKRLIQLTSERPHLDVGLSVFDRVYTDSFQHRFSSYTDER